MSDRFIKVWSTLCVTNDECLELLKEDSSFEYSMKPIEQIIELDVIDKFVMRDDFSKMVFTLNSKIRIYIELDCKHIFELLMLSGEFEFVKKSDDFKNTDIYTHKRKN